MANYDLDALINHVFAIKVEANKLAQCPDISQAAGIPLGKLNSELADHILHCEFCFARYAAAMPADDEENAAVEEISRRIIAFAERTIWWSDLMVEVKSKASSDAHRPRPTPRKKQAVSLAAAYRDGARGGARVRGTGQQSGAVEQRGWVISISMSGVTVINHGGFSVQMKQAGHPVLTGQGLPLAMAGAPAIAAAITNDLLKGIDPDWAEETFGERLAALINTTIVDCASEEVERFSHLLRHSETILTATVPTSSVSGGETVAIEFPMDIPTFDLLSSSQHISWIVLLNCADNKQSMAD